MYRGCPGSPLRLRAKRLEESLCLCFQAIQCSVVLKDRVRELAHPRLRQLRREPTECIGADGVPVGILVRLQNTRSVTLQPVVLWRADDDHVVESRVPRHALLTAERSLEHKRGFHDGHGQRIFPGNGLHPCRLRGDHRGVNDGVQLVEAAFFKREPRQCRPVQRAVSPHHARAEERRNGRVHRRARLHQGAAYLIALRHVRAHVPQHGRHGAFAAGRTARKRNAQHARRASRDVRLRL